MRKMSYKRWGAHEITADAKKGSIHVATKSYVRYAGEISYLASYLTSRVMPQDPEETQIAQIVLQLQNILEHELELVLARFVEINSSAENQDFLTRVKGDFVSFKTKVEWLFARNVVAVAERDIMEEVRRLRNEVIHSRPTAQRRKYKYFDSPLMTRVATKRLFTDVNNTIRTLRSISGNPEKWNVIPPGYAQEMGWQISRPTGPEPSE
jgi:hypothetical protein